MSAHFDTLLDIADDSLDSEFGEWFTLVPMREVINGRPVPDTRPGAKLIAIFDDPGERMEETGVTPRLVNHPTLSVREGSTTRRIRRPDRFVRAKTGKVYEVRNPNPDGMGRIWLELAEVPK